MSAVRLAGIGLLAIAIVVGTVSDRPQSHAPVWLGGYRVLAADFHVHTSLLNDTATTPMGLVLEARRQGLDALAITPHQQVFDAYLGRWFSRQIGGPTVIVGQEILHHNYHMIAVGITGSIGWRMSAAQAIDEIHRQGGVAIAAHPGPEFWSGYDDVAMKRLDGAEICHPMIYARDGAQQDLEKFYARAPLTAIGSSDYHGLGRLGLCRTYVFASDSTEAAILEALRHRRTVVFGLNGKAYGDPALVRLAVAERGFRQTELDAAASDHATLTLISRWCGVIGLFVVVVVGPTRRVSFVDEKISLTPGAKARSSLQGTTV